MPDLQSNFKRIPGLVGSVDGNLVTTNGDGTCADAGVAPDALAPKANAVLSGVTSVTGSLVLTNGPALHGDVTGAYCSLDANNVGGHLIHLQSTGTDATQGASCFVIYDNNTATTTLQLDDAANLSIGSITLFSGNGSLGSDGSLSLASSITGNGVNGGAGGLSGQNISTDGGAFSTDGSGNLDATSAAFSQTLSAASGAFVIDTSGNGHTTGTYNGAGLSISGNSTLHAASGSSLSLSAGLTAASVSGGAMTGSSLSISGNTIVAGASASSVSVSGNTTLHAASASSVSVGSSGVTFGTGLTITSVTSAINLGSGNFTVDTSGNTRISGFIAAQGGKIYLASQALGAVEDSKFEYDGTHLYFTVGSTRHQISFAT